MNWSVAWSLASLPLCVAIGLSSCVISHPDYPSAWAPLEELSAGSCPKLDGLFLNASEERPIGTLSSMLLRHRPEPPKDRGFSGFTSSPLDIRMVHSTEGTLEVYVYEFRGAAEPIASGSFSRRNGDFDCDSSWMNFKFQTDTVASEGIVAIGAGFVALARSKDGFIVAKASLGSAGLAMGIIPAAGTTTMWYRFKPAPPQPVRRENEPVYGP